MSKYNVNNPRPTPSQERLKELLDYDPITGILTWKNHKNRTDLNGKPCGHARNKDGHLSCEINSIKYFAHRIIYKWMTGEDPVIMDHINGKGDDNRWHNLRNVTHRENSLNSKLPIDNKSGCAGVYYHEKQERWHANVRQFGKSIHLGSYKDKETAVSVRKAVNKILGFSERHGNAA